MSCGSGSQLIADIIATFRKARGGSLASTDPEFWVAMAQAGARELAEVPRTRSHFIKELADLVFIGIDGLAAFDEDPETVIRARLAENGKKDLSHRDTDFYRRKAEVRP